MRILGFSKKWNKLQQPKFTTFRFPRKDRDWGVGEIVQIVFKPRSKKREILGSVKICNKKQRWVIEPRTFYIGRIISEREAREDGFANYTEMWQWFKTTYGKRLESNPLMNKLTLRWINGN